ncbi:MAG: type II methionyl aminopeptidase [Thermoplasmata archaeon]|nr:MAG: type II methionyl aminopeptidase [Thermoplasmata archaeon]HDH81779.1 type II methionyl aminopeptidase [Thermoplasmatales archaeon]
MNEEIYEQYRKAGRVLGKALSAGAKMVKEGVRYLDVAEEIERIISSEAGLSFPVNISVNEVAAHYTPSLNDSLKFKKGDVVKIDAGSHVNGYIGDSALTVEVGSNENEHIIKASEEALQEAIEIVRAGVSIAEIGETIEKKIKSYGLRPVKNLQGHSLERYNLHAGLSIPNVSNNNSRKLKEGEVIAIEPFATNGSGYVVDRENGNIYLLKSRAKGRIADEMRKKFDGLPFASRWMEGIVGWDKVNMTLAFMLRRRTVYAYKKLVEVDGGIVAQTEHTLLVKKDGCEVLTSREKT